MAARNIAIYNNGEIMPLSDGDIISLVESSILFNIPSTNETAAGYIDSGNVTANAAGYGNLGAFSSGNIVNANATDDTALCRVAVLDSSTGSGLYIIRYGYIKNTSWNWTGSRGAPLYLSTTNGAITETAPSSTGNVQQQIGEVYDADIILFNPSKTYIELS